MKRIIAFPALLLALCLPAAAADTDYTGIVDPVSGEACTEGSGASASGSGRSVLSANMYTTGTTTITSTPSGRAWGRSTPPRQTGWCSPPR